MKAGLPLSRVLQQIFALEASKGHLRWKVSDLARQCGVSRPLIYYHLGRTKKEILESSIDLMADKLLALSGNPKELFSAEFVNECVRAQGFVSKHPAVTLAYLRCRSGSSKLKAKFVEIEKRYEKLLTHPGVSLSPTEVKALHTMLHGIIHSPFADEESVRTAIAQLKQILIR
jgi:AcrR family transcriptional regulator